MECLKDKKGEGYIEVAVFVLAGAFFLAFSIEIFGFLVKRQKLDYFAKELAECASVYGTTKGPVEERYDSLCEQLGLEPECDFRGTVYFDDEKETVQLGEEIFIRLTLTEKAGVSGVFGIPVTISASGTGLSEQYWK